MLQSIEIRNCMQHQPPRVLADSHLHEALETIIAHQVSGVCVVNHSGHLVGILSEMDCLRAILSATYNESEVGTVHHYMSSEVEIADSSEDIVDVASRMLRQHRRRLPVVEDGRLVGQITCRQILSAVKTFAARHPASEHTPS